MWGHLGGRRRGGGGGGGLLYLRCGFDCVVIWFQTNSPASRAEQNEECRLQRRKEPAEASELPLPSVILTFEQQQQPQSRPETSKGHLTGGFESVTALNPAPSYISVGKNLTTNPAPFPQTANRLNCSSRSGKVTVQSCSSTGECLILTTDRPSWWQQSRRKDVAKRN